jgi:hypothetical protein
VISAPERREPTRRFGPGRLFICPARPSHFAPVRFMRSSRPAQVQSFLGSALSERLKAVWRGWWPVIKVAKCGLMLIQSANPPTN